MKEDKLDRLIAASLKKKLEEAEVPYELGAWESFQKKRKLRQRKTTAYWAGGIAAGLALLLAVGKVMDTDSLRPVRETEEILAEQFQSEESQPTPPDTVYGPKESSSVEPTGKDPEPEEIKPSGSSQLATQDSEVKSPAKAASEPVQQEQPIQLKENQLAVTPTIPELPVKPEIQVEQKAVAEANTAAENQNTGSEKAEEKPAQSLALAESEKPDDQELLALSEDMKEKTDFPEIEKDRTMVNLGMGVSPGFGGSQASNRATSASTIGLGMLVDIDLPGKLVVGSGLGLNYLNQVNEVQSSIQAYGNSYPQTDKTEVRQVQIEIPVFVKYPITRNNSVSLQAGFSNFYALNQKADLEYTANAPVPSYSANSLGSSSFSIQNRVVQENSVLESKDGRFYPFATVNLGINLRVLETEGASYVIMPFYNYQVKQISGYGDTYGLFGASFKMNFGGK